MHYLLAAIMFLAPHLPKTVAKGYARIINVEAARKRIDPLLVVSFIHVETARQWNSRLHSVTNDFGLTQVHVAANGSASFLGREEELYNPATNIREWSRLADMWRAYHKRECGTRRMECYEGIPGVWAQSWCITKVVRQPDHPWWAHLKWGYRVKDTEHAMKVKRVYEGLKRRFSPEVVALLEEGRCSTPVN
jgi:hypothetical protein